MGGICYPVLFGALALCIGLLAYVAYCVMDRRLDASIAAAQDEPEEGFKLADLRQIVTSKGFWLHRPAVSVFYSASSPS